jgi:hypothetical protein
VYIGDDRTDEDAFKVRWRRRPLTGDFDCSTCSFFLHNLMRILNLIVLQLTMAAGAEEEGSGHRHPRLQVPQGDERLLLPAGPERGHGLLASAGGVEAQVVAAAADDPAAGVAGWLPRRGSRSAAGRLASQSTDRSNRCPIMRTYPTTNFPPSDDSS